MKRMLGLIVFVLFIPLAACQLQPIDRAIDPIGIQLIVPERVEAGSTTLALKVNNSQLVDESHIQVTRQGSDVTRTYEVTEKEGYLVASVPIEQGIYYVNGMVHEGAVVYTPGAWMVVGDVPEKEWAHLFEEDTAEAPHGGGGHHH